MPQTVDIAVRDLLRLINLARQDNRRWWLMSRSLPALRWSEPLSNVAIVQAAYCVDRGQFDHNRPPGTSLTAQAMAFGYQGSRPPTENIAWGIGLSPERVVQMWLDSKRHRKNMLDPLMTDVGIDMQLSRAGERLYVAVFGQDQT